MMQDRRKLIVIGHGAAGLAAAVSAAEHSRNRGLPVDITVLEKSREAEAGGNTRWSPSNMRLATDGLDGEFQAEVLSACGGRANLRYFRALAENGTATIKWLESHDLEFVRPVYYLSVGPARIQPIGGGRAVIDKLTIAAKKMGVGIRYESEAVRLLTAEGHRVCGVQTRSLAGVPTTLEAHAVILATGGFQGNPAMMRAHFGAAAESLRLISPGSRFNTGDGIRMAAEQGARISGDWGGMHVEPVDPRSKSSAAVVLVYPYRIVVDQNGERVFDEGGGLMHETWEALARCIHFDCPNSVAYAILDSRLFDIEGFERAIRSDVPPYRSLSLEGLAPQIGIPAANLKATVETFNAAGNADHAQFDASRSDGLSTVGTFKPPKSNWAREIVRPPYLAYPLVAAIAYTFGGLDTNDKTEVLCEQGPIPGLYAAGETTGHFYGRAPNAVAVLRALVFGQIAGREAVDFLQ